MIVMYHHEYEIASTQVSPARELRLSSLLQILQDVATDGASYLGIGTDVTYPKGLLWVISRMEIEVISMPKYQQKVDVYTYPGKTLGFFYPRHFVIYDMEGNVMLRAASVWALIHKEDRRVEMHNQFPFIEGETYEGELSRPIKLPALNDAPILEERKIRYSDVDLNGHLNNTKYVEMIEDLESGSVHASKRIKHVTLNYEREIHEGETIVLKGQIGLESEVTGFLGGLPAFEAKIQYEPWTQNH